jgi:uncharacterized protein
VKEKDSENRRELLVRVLKFDGTEHRLWRASLSKQDGALLVLYAAFAEEVRHAQLGLIRRGTVSVEYYWLDRWYNVFRFLEPDGSTRNFYCNVNLPPTFDGRTLSYVDLDLDVLVHKDFSYETLDMDEFEAHAQAFGYPPDVRERALGALDELISFIEARAFPFNEL